MHRHFFRLRPDLLVLLFAALLPLTSRAEAAAVPFARRGQRNCESITCDIIFPTVPARRMWIVRFVSCATAIDDVSGKILYLYFVAFRKSERIVGLIQMQPTALGGDGGSVRYAATESAYLPVPSGSTMGVTMAAASGDTITFLGCTIGGDSIPSR